MAGWMAGWLAGWFREPRKKRLSTCSHHHGGEVVVVGIVMVDYLLSLSLRKRERERENAHARLVNKSSRGSYRVLVVVEISFIFCLHRVLGVVVDIFIPSSFALTT